MSADHRAERLGLTGLDPVGVGAFIEAAAGHALADEEGEQFVRVVWEETEGNPFFVAEVIRHLTESGAIEQRDGRWVAIAPVEALGIPEGVRDVVGGAEALSMCPPENRVPIFDIWQILLDCGLGEVPLAHQVRSLLLPYADQAVTLAVLGEVGS